MKRLAIIFLSATLLSSPALAEDNKVVATYIDGNVTAAQVMEQFKSVLEMQPENKGKSFSQLDKNIQELKVKIREIIV